MNSKSFFRTILDRLVEGRQRSADAYVATYLQSHPEISRELRQRPTRGA
jgi:hypothetical protein